MHLLHHGPFLALPRTVVSEWDLPFRNQVSETLEECSIGSTTLDEIIGCGIPLAPPHNPSILRLLRQTLILLLGLNSFHILLKEEFVLPHIPAHEGHSWWVRWRISAIFRHKLRD